MLVGNCICQNLLYLAAGEVRSQEELKASELLGRHLIQAISDDMEKRHKHIAHISTQITYLINATRLALDSLSAVVKVLIFNLDWRLNTRGTSDVTEDETLDTRGHSE